MQTTLTANQAKFLSEIEVNLGVEIGELELSAEDLIDLYSGQIFEFSFEPTNIVRLRVGEEQVATAKFVRQGENLALEIISVGSETS